MKCWLQELRHTPEYPYSFHLKQLHKIFSYLLYTLLKDSGYQRFYYPKRFFTRKMKMFHTHSNSFIKKTSPSCQRNRLWYGPGISKITMSTFQITFITDEWIYNHRFILPQLGIYMFHKRCLIYIFFRFPIIWQLRNTIYK